MMTTARSSIEAVVRRVCGRGADQLVRLAGGGMNEPHWAHSLWRPRTQLAGAHASPLLVALPDPGSRIRGASVPPVTTGYGPNLASMAEVTDVAELPDGMTLP